MRLATYRTDDSTRLGVVVGDELVDLAVAAPDLPGSLRGLLAAGDAALEAVAGAARAAVERIPLDSVALAAPIPSPSSFFAIGLNYRDHVLEGGPREIPTRPTVFAKLPNTVVGPYDDVQRPLLSEQLDYEGELAFVIGRTCRHVSRKRAHEVIAGYTVVNDVSVRDWQISTSQWVLGKSFDTHGPMGPWLVTADELDDPHSLRLTTTVNGEVRQQANTRDFIFDCFAIVEHISGACTLQPGDVITTGTPAGVAIHRRPQVWLVPGDVVRVEIEGIGAIENSIILEPASEAAGDAASASQSVASTPS